jgi:HAD superfamily hydrolase (TIGR01509 family)
VCYDQPFLREWDEVIKAVVFDFDGLILDTETHEYSVLQEIYKEYGADLPLEVWGKCIGTKSNFFDPHDYLEEQIGSSIDRDLIKLKRREKFDALIQNEKALPGVAEYLEAAKQLGLKIGLASSSNYEWVSKYLVHLGLFDYFECIRTSDNVEQVKPDPALYLQAVECLGVKPEEAIALEDSANGAIAAKKAGLYCVVVPNAVTKHMMFEEIDYKMETMAEMQLEELINKFSGVEGDDKA